MLAAAAAGATDDALAWSGIDRRERTRSGPLATAAGCVAAEAGHVTIATNLANAAGEFPLANSTLSVGPVGLVPKASATEAFEQCVQFCRWFSRRLLRRRSSCPRRRCRNRRRRQGPSPRAFSSHRLRRGARCRTRLL